jgi:hypothetical protein
MTPVAPIHATTVAVRQRAGWRGVMILGLSLIHI